MYIPLRLNFCKFDVRSVCGLAAICKSFVRKNLDINGYARYNGSQMMTWHRKMALIIFTLPANSINSLTSLVRYSALCSCLLWSMYSFCLSPKRRSMSDLEMVISHWWQQAVRKARLRRGTREYHAQLITTEADRQLRIRNEPHTRASQRIRKWRWPGMPPRMGYLRIFHPQIFKHHCVQHPWISKCEICRYKKSAKYI